MNRRRLLFGALAVTLLLPPAAGPHSLLSPLRAELGEDDYSDLAIGVPWDQLQSYRPGSVAVFYGSSYPGISGANQLLTQNASGTWEGAEDNDEFGKALATGDFDGDGFYDLAIGAPQEDFGASWSLGSAGSVSILFGAASGLTSRSQILYQNLLNDAETGDRYGSALAAGDFDGDGFDDLAVGVPEEDLGAKADAGEVNVYYGTPVGLLAGAGRQVWNQDILGVNWGAGAGDRFGSVLATGDFDHDGFDDLAVGVPGEDSLVAVDMGAVNIIYGTAAGLKVFRAQQWHQDAPGVLSGADPGDLFGSSLAAGDFDGDGYKDLAVGVPYEDIEATLNAGAVNVLFGSASGLTGDGSEFWKQKIGNSDLPEKEDRFGWALTAGNFDNDPYDDLAIGVPYEDVGAAVNAGAVHVVYGSASGLYSKHAWWFHQDLLDLTDAAEGGDAFGWALAAGDFDGNGCDDLAVGVPYEDIGPSPGDNGLVNVIYGTLGGLGSAGRPNQLWWQGSTNVSGSPSANDRFGWALAAIPRVYRAYLPVVQRDS